MSEWQRDLGGWHISKAPSVHNLGNATLIYATHSRDLVLIKPMHLDKRLYVGGHFPRYWWGRTSFHRKNFQNAMEAS